MLEAGGELKCLMSIFVLVILLLVEVWGIWRTFNLFLYDLGFHSYVMLDAVLYMTSGNFGFRFSRGIYLDTKLKVFQHSFS